ncbi:MAG: response regulator, partial [Methylococcaceae bacterium]
MKPFRLLYAEDNAQDAELTLTHFAEYAPEIEIEIISTGQGCMERLGEASFDLLLLDYRLPDMNGLEVMKGLAQTGLSVPVVLITGAGDEQLVGKALRLGAVSYVTKGNHYLETLPEQLCVVLEDHLTKQSLGLPTANDARKILYVEHLAMDIEMIQSYFSEAVPHFIVDVVQTCAIALERLSQTHDYDLVLIDLLMPDQSGLDLLIEARQLRLKMPPFLIITGQGNESMTIAAMKLGAVDYLCKHPDYLDQLPHRIDYAITQHRLVKAAELQLQHRIIEHELELQQRNRRYHAVIHAINQGFLRLDRDGLIMEANLAYVRLSGYSEAELVGMRVADLESLKSPKQVANHIHKIMQHSTTTFETRHRRKDGSDWDVEVNTAFIEEEGDYFIALIKDISKRKRDEQLLKKASLTERRQLGQDLKAITLDLGVHQVQLEMQNEALQKSSRALEQSRDRYADLFDFAPIGYLSLTDKGQITKINLTGAKLLGIERQAAINQSIGHFLAPNECDHWYLHNSETLKHHNKQSGEFYLQREDGTVFYALLDCQRRDILASIRIHISFTDITERKQLEQLLRQAQKMEVLGQMTGGIAHDFNNILAVILGYSNLALERCVDQPTDKLARYLAEVISASERARDLIAKMLAYSRTSASVASVPLDMAQEIGKAVTMVSAAIPAGIKVVTRIEPYVRSVRIDPIDVQQLVVNLAMNARDAIGEQGSIEIALKQVTLNDAHCAICHMPINGEYVSLEVKDNGFGISDQLQQQIFDPFFTTKDIGKGTG